MRPFLFALGLACITVLSSSRRAQEHALPYDAPQVQIAVDSAPFQRLFDFDGDGDPDAVGTKSKGSAQTGYKTDVVVYAWRNDGQGRYTEVLQELDAAPPLMLNLTTVGTTSVLNDMRVTVGDFDGDGKQDFALGGGTELWTYHSNGDGSFARGVSALGGVLKDLQAADFDGDGKSDLLILLPTSIELRWKVSGARRVEMRIDGRPFSRYGNGAFDELLPLRCDGSAHTYTLVATAPGRAARRTVTVTTKRTA